MQSRISHETRKDLTAEAPQVFEEVVEYIKDFESKLQTAMNDMCCKLADATFKDLRRQLPVTRTKIEWGQINAYRVGQALNRR